MLVFGIETSCDETALALYDTERGLIDDKIFSQIKLFTHYGGVVPELASRDHQKQIVPIFELLLADNNLSLDQIDVFAYTTGPGLSSALLTGAMFATALAFTLGKPCVPVHHLEGHLLAPMLSKNNQYQYPFLALLISGGHTEFVLAKSYRQYKKIGATLDDAVGELFDKVAVMMNLGYPGGPAIEKLATKCEDFEKVKQLNFPRPMINRQGLEFSFSGLKTFAKNTILDLQQSGKMAESDKAVVAFALQQAIAETIAIKCGRAITATGVKTLILAGGVASNKYLRSYLSKYIQQFSGVSIVYPELKYCTDNGAMIAYAGALDYKTYQRSSYQVSIKAKWDIETISNEVSS